MGHTANKYQAGDSGNTRFWQAVGMPPRGASLHRILREGLPYKVIKNLAELADLELRDLARYVVIPQATLQRRAKLGKFKVDESDRLYRFAEVLKAATDLFEGDTERARRWLLTPVRGLGGQRPVEMLTTTAETEAVLELIGRLEHGVFS